jgi:hypothetical protein
MDWIKRNLYFVIGSAVALLLLGGAGFYYYSTWKANSEVLTKLHEQYAKLSSLNSKNPHPGRPPESDNIKLAKEQEQQLSVFKEQAQKSFQRIPNIPEGAKVAGEEFVTSLRHTIDQLQKAATNSSIGIPSDYGFSFTAQRNLMRYKEGTLEPLSVQVGEVKAICDVLFQARVNNLEYIHRERITPEDNQATSFDYLVQKSVTNDLAVLTPYEVKFRCFTPELAQAVSGFANSPHGLIVKTINVEPAPAVEATPADVTMATPVIPYYPSPSGAPSPDGVRPGGRAEEAASAAAFRRRYGLDSRYGRGPMPIPPPTTPQVAAPVAPTAPSKGLQTVLDEKQLLVTMMLNVVKLLPPSSK